jgi:hypothetical protein
LVPTHIKPAPEAVGPCLVTRAEALALLKIGETTLFWLERTKKLKAVRIGRRVLFNVTEIRRIAAHGATLSEAEKKTASGGDHRPSDGGRSRKHTERLEVGA